MLTAFSMIPFENEREFAHNANKTNLPHRPGNVFYPPRSHFFLYMLSNIYAVDTATGLSELVVVRCVGDWLTEYQHNN